MKSVRVAVVGVLAAFLAVAAACASSTRRSAMDEAPEPLSSRTPLRIFASGDTRGYLEPCGCEGGQFGGVPRRATYLSRVRRPGDLRIDLGNLAAGTGDLRRLRREALLDALAAEGCDVIVPGRSEVVDGAEFDDAAAARGLTVVCANLVAADGRPVFPAYASIGLADGRRAAVIGITEEIDAVAAAADAVAGRRVVPAEPALRAALSDLAGRADVVIVATSLAEPRARALADAFPGVALVLSGATPRPDVESTRTANGLVVAAGLLGAYVARVDFDDDLRAAASWRAWLDERVPDDVAAAALVIRYREAVAALDTGMIARIVDARRAEGFAGSAACASCHAADHAAWAASLHGRAMHTLADRKANRDPDCVPCHLVDVPAGAAAFDPDTMGVGCEACHGGSAAHVADPSVRTPARDSGRGACASQCHHPPEVKSFDFDLQWPRIRHGGR